MMKKNEFVLKQKLQSDRKFRQKQHANGINKTKVKEHKAWNGIKPLQRICV